MQRAGSALTVVSNKRTSLGTSRYHTSNPANVCDRRTGLEKSLPRRTMAHFIRVIDSMTTYQLWKPIARPSVVIFVDIIARRREHRRSFLYPADPLGLLQRKRSVISERSGRINEDERREMKRGDGWKLCRIKDYIVKFLDANIRLKLFSFKYLLIRYRMSWMSMIN